MKYLRKLYDLVLGWAEKQLGLKAFAEISFTEASFFLIPLNVLLFPIDEKIFQT